MSNRFSKKNSLPPDKCPHCKIYTGDKFTLGFRSHVRFCSTTNFKNKKKSRSQNVDQLDSLNLSVNNNLSSVNESLVDREDLNQNVMESSPLFQMSPKSTLSPQLHPLVEENNHFEDNFDNDNDNFDQTGVPSTQIIDELYRTKYLKWQYKIQDLLYNSNNNDGDDSNQSSSNNLSNSLRLGWVYDVTKTRRGVPNTLDLLELFTFVKQNWLSNDKGDALLQVVTQIVLRHPTKDYLFLYKKFISINAAVSKAVNELYSLYDYNILLPDKLRGSNNTEKTSIKRILDSRNQNPVYEPARLMGIIRFYDEVLKKDIVLYAIAYLQKVKLNLIEKKQLPSDNMYKYFFSDHGHLWFDLITSDKIQGPLIGLSDPDSVSNNQNTLLDNIRNAQKLRFIIQRTFFRDPTKTSKRNVDDFNLLVNNLLRLIPLPDENE
jgi:hypothetical protein